MKEIEIVIDKGNGEKKIIISSGKISLSLSDDSILSKHNASVLVIAGNGDFPAPFESGSRILRHLRETSACNFEDWKLALPLQMLGNDFFKFPIKFPSDLETKHWGIWIHSSENLKEYPDIILINFPLWILRTALFTNEEGKTKYVDLLSHYYRFITSGLSAIFSFHLGKRYEGMKKSIVFSDLGNNLIDRSLIDKMGGDLNYEDDLFQTRIRVFSEVLSDWITLVNSFDVALISCGEGIRMDLVEKAWDLQVELISDQFTEFGEALALRSKNVDYITRIIQHNSNKSLQNVLIMARSTFSNSTPSLSADLIQTRTLAEALSLELCHKFNLTAQNGNLFSYIQRLEESKLLSPWITSYLHVIRQLGNEAAHYKIEACRRPEKPVGKDLIVIHATLNRVLSFCADEFY